MYFLFVRIWTAKSLALSAIATIKHRNIDTTMGFDTNKTTIQIIYQKAATAVVVVVVATTT